MEETVVVLKRVKGQATQHLNTDERTVTWVMTTGEDVDRDGETVDPRGVNYDRFLLNPVVCWQHETEKIPIGRILGKPWLEEIGSGTDYEEVGGPKQTALLGRVQFDTDPYSDSIYQKVKRGFIKGGSISFVPTDKPSRNKEGGNHYGATDLLEFSICTIGSNHRALATHKKCLKNPDGTCKTTCPCKAIRKGTGYVAVVGGVLPRTA